MPERRIDRRTFLKGGVAAGGALLGGTAMAAVAKEVAGPTAPPPAPHRRGHPHARVGQPTTSVPEQALGSPPPARRAPVRSAQPNILVVVVDQLRTPQWFTASPALARMLPNISRLRREGVSFEHHYTASNDCTPARSTLLTGLYTHQTGCMITGGSTLDPGFPTWGTMLREQGYETWWYRQVAPHAQRQQVDGAGERGGPGALRLRRRHLPVARRRPRSGLARGPADRQPVRTVVLRKRRLRAAVVHDRVVRQPARHRVVAQVDRTGPLRAYRTGAGARGCPPTTRRRRCSKPSTSRCCSSRCSKPRRERSGRCRSPVRGRSGNGSSSWTCT